MRRLSTQILIVQLVILGVTSLIGFVLFAFVQRARLEHTYELQAASIAQTAASDPPIRNAMAAGVVGGIVQSEAERIRIASGASFVVVIDLHRIRHSHPDPALIGQAVSEPIAVLDGRTHTGINTGATGTSANAKAPLYGPTGALEGEVSTGIPISRATTELWRELPDFALFAALVLAGGSAASVLLARRLKRTTFGLELDEIAGLLQDREAILHGIREGVVCFDPQGRVSVLNNEARRLLALPADAKGRTVTELGLDPPAVEMLSPGHLVTDAVLPVKDRLLAVNNRPTGREGGPPGSVVTLRDSTELRLLSTRAEEARLRLKLLYDASVRIGTTLDVTRTADELARVAVPSFADFATVDLAEPILRGEEPPPTDHPAVMHRTASRGLRDDHPLYSAGESITFAPASPQGSGIDSGRPVLERELATSPGFHAQEPERARRILEYGIHSLIAVPLRARGVPLGVVNFWRSERPEPFEEDDLSLAEELAARAAVCIDNARRYTHEHSVAVTLQRSLLPRSLPAQDALDVAHRYLPAEEGVAGDWFDLIPLPGARVALVVGDVIGHGLHAAATMGRLRTAVQNFSTLDLPPDELLFHLDELVARIDQDGSDTDGSIIGATCLYAIYDPASGHCTLARAGHPLPLLVHPDGTTEFIHLPAGPPLGLSGLPFEATELHLPENSRLVLYTDGLVKNRERPIDTGLDLLRTTLAHPDRTPEDTCDAVLAALQPDHPSDDIALLVARPRRLAADQQWYTDVPSDPAAVAAVRAAITRQLADWDLDELAFVTELMLSELVTNAIRYATGPIRVRLLHGRTLICEVSDTSSTAPHLRYAATTDEGGRGLFLVAQLADRWGTRHTPEGKVIWTEQALP